MLCRFLRVDPNPKHGSLADYTNTYSTLIQVVSFLKLESSQTKSSLYRNNRQPNGSLSNVLRKPAGEDGSRALRPPRCVSTGPVVVRLAELAI